ncbi:MAG: sigma-54 dependent transcriptional regulator [Treponema sp.]|jgi:two-component system response regulator AtoC|nr:sigma-54 dependent transcriptional regulator [Treponema sp.]
MRILIVDDEKNIRESLRKYCGLESIEAVCSGSAEEALAILEETSFDALVTDLKLQGADSGMDGQALLEAVQEKGFPVPVIMISAHGQITDAVNALKAGARDYLVKPFDPAELVIRLRALVEDRRRENLIETESRSRRLAARRGNEPGSGGMIGESEVMRTLLASIDKIAASDVTVLVTGESGTGKEVAAREIHGRGRNRAEPFAAVNIGGIHETLMESELFGHEKGSFTGAAGRRQGLFELAGHGTIFLDEIGEMPAALQVKLLRVIQERKIRRLGGSADIPVNARIISATNKDVEALVREGVFREDLYYRLNVFRLRMPPLRERRNDIPLLASYLLDKLSSRMGRKPLSLSAAAMEKLAAWDFPGNVRELENILERAVIFCESPVIGPGDIDIHMGRFQNPGETSRRPNAGPLPNAAPLSDNGPNPDDLSASDGGAVSEGGPLPEKARNGSGKTRPQSLEDIERNAILSALERCEGNRTRAAEELGITRKTILNKLKKASR